LKNKIKRDVMKKFEKRKKSLCCIFEKN